jgi:hypothetical protein
MLRLRRTFNVRFVPKSDIEKSILAAYKISHFIQIDHVFLSRVFTVGGVCYSRIGNISH